MPRSPCVEGSAVSPADITAKGVAGSGPLSAVADAWSRGTAPGADGGASTLAYNTTSNTPGYITATTPGASSGAQAITMNSGEIRGLLDLKNTKLPGISDQLGEFVSRAAQ